MNAPFSQSPDDLDAIGGAVHEGFDPFLKASDFFTKGNCHQLALALVAAIDGASFVAIYDRFGEDGEEVETPRMVHAAAKIGDRILDIEGFVAERAWTDAWSDLARDARLAEFEPGELPYEFTSHLHQAFAERTAARLVRYWESELAPSGQAPTCRLRSRNAVLGH